MNTVYIAGKISGDANYKEKFNTAQKNLEKQGFVVMNPTRLPSEEFSHDAYMSIGKAMLKECDMFCLLPDWEESTRACDELILAASLKKKIVYYPDIIGKTDNNMQNAYYYKIAMQGHSGCFRRMFGQTYESKLSANITKPSHCDYIIKTEISPDKIDAQKAVSILTLTTDAYALDDLALKKTQETISDIADLCTGIANISENCASDNIEDIETAFTRRIVSPLGVFYASS